MMWEVEPVRKDVCARCGAVCDDAWFPTPGCRREYPRHDDVLAPDARAAAHVYGWTWLREGRVADVMVRGATVTRWRVERTVAGVKATMEVV